MASRDTTERSPAPGAGEPRIVGKGRHVFRGLLPASDPAYGKSYAIVGSRRRRPGPKSEQALEQAPPRSSESSDQERAS